LFEKLALHPSPPTAGYSHGSDMGFEIHFWSAKSRLNRHVRKSSRSGWKMRFDGYIEAYSDFKIVKLHQVSNSPLACFFSFISVVTRLSFGSGNLLVSLFRVSFNHPSPESFQWRTGESLGRF
jgi:hypothetical protein